MDLADSLHAEAGGPRKTAQNDNYKWPKKAVFGLDTWLRIDRYKLHRSLGLTREFTRNIRTIVNFARSMDSGQPDRRDQKLMQSLDLMTILEAAFQFGSHPTYSSVGNNTRGSMAQLRIPDQGS